MRMREQANQNFLRQPQMMMQNQMGMRRNGVPNMNNMNLQKTALQNNASGINASAMYVSSSYTLWFDQALALYELNWLIVSFLGILNK